MEVQELKQLIKQKDIPNFLIFTGEEYHVQKLYIQQIAKVKNLGICYIDTIDDIWMNLGVKSLFNLNAVYVVRDDKVLMTEEKVYSKIVDKLADNMLILQLTSVDKRLKMLKLYKDSIVEFNALNEAVLTRYIQKEIALSDKNCHTLVEVCENNYGHCLLEIDKIKRWREVFIRDKEEPIPFDGAFLHLLTEGAIYVPPKNLLWDFIKAVLKNRPLIAYEYYRNLKELEIPTFVILSNLYNETKHVLQVQVCTSKDVEKSTGLTAWQIKNARECVNNFKAVDLAYLMRLIQRVESDIKRGKIDEEIAIDYILTNFL